jgi:hypothetical protein
MVNCLLLVLQVFLAPNPHTLSGLANYPQLQPIVLHCQLMPMWSSSEAGSLGLVLLVNSCDLGSIMLSSCLRLVMHATGRVGGLDGFFPSFPPLRLISEFRNGGHIDPNLYQDYDELVEDHGTEMAQKIIRFRLSHMDAMQTVAAEEDLIGHSQFRRTKVTDVFLTREGWENAKVQMTLFRKDMPEEAAVLRLQDGREVPGVSFFLASVISCLFTPFKVPSFEESVRLCHTCVACGSPLSICDRYTCSPTQTSCQQVRFFSSEWLRH